MIVNPQAGRGRMAPLWPTFRSELLRHFHDIVIIEETDPDRTREHARRMTLEGASLIIAAGDNDSLVVDGILSGWQEGKRPPDFGFLPVQLGGDSARALGLAGTPAALVGRIAVGTVRKLDAIRVTYRNPDGIAAIRHGLNVMTLGVSAEIVERAARPGRPALLPGRIVYLLSTIRSILGYRYDRVAIGIDDAPPVDAEIVVVAVANGSHIGGGMAIAPEAAMDDGLLEVVIVRRTSRLELLDQLGRVYSGAHRGRPEVTIQRGRRIDITPLADDPNRGARIELDGSVLGRLPATVEVLPGAIRLRA